MLRILVGAVLAAVVVYVWNMASWMFLGLHDDSMARFEESEVVVEALVGSAKESGTYFIPNPPETQDMESPEFKEFVEKHKAGPVATIFFSKEGIEPMSPQVMGIGFGLVFASALIAAVLLSMTSGIGFFGRVLFVALLGVFAAIEGHGSLWNWMHFPQDWTIAMATDVVVGWALAGILLAIIIRPRSAAYSP